MAAIDHILLGVHTQYCWLLLLLQCFVLYLAALLNPELSAQTWAIKAILRGLLKCSHSRISESVVLTVSHLLNTPCTRRYIRSQLDVEVRDKMSENV